MNVALVIWRGSAQAGGAERYTVDLAGELIRNGHRVQLLCADGKNPPDGIPLCVLQPSGLTKFNQYRSFLRQLSYQLRQTQYDVVHAMLPVRHCDLYQPHSGLAAEAMASGHRKHVHRLHRAAAWTTTQLNPKRQCFAAVERQMLLGPRGPSIVCLSSLITQQARKHYHLGPDRLIDLFNAVKLERFDPEAAKHSPQNIRARHHIASDGIVALMIAQNFALKGLRQSIQAIARLDDPRLVLLVVGTQSPAEYLKLAKQLGIENRIIFAGGTSDPTAYYAAADFFLLPTRQDTCSLVVLEALAMGLPVISTVFNGACDIMRDGEHGFILADPFDIDRLTSAVGRLMDDALRADCARACLALRPSLSFTDHVEKLIKIYQTIRRRRSDAPGQGAAL